PDAGVDPHLLARAEAAGLGVARVHQQRAAVPSLHEAGAVVHPGVVGAQLATADQAKRSRRRALVAGFGLHLGEASGETAEVGDEARGGQADPLVRRVEPGRQRRLERAEVDAVRALPKALPGEAAAEGREPRAVGAETEKTGRDAARA